MSVRTPPVPLRDHQQSRSLQAFDNSLSLKLFLFLPSVCHWNRCSYHSATFLRVDFELSFQLPRTPTPSAPIQSSLPWSRRVRSKQQLKRKRTDGKNHLTTDKDRLIRNKSQAPDATSFKSLYRSTPARRRNHAALRSVALQIRPCDFRVPILQSGRVRPASAALGRRSAGLRTSEMIPGFDGHSEKLDERVHCLLGSLFHEPMPATLQFDHLDIGCYALHLWTKDSGAGLFACDR
jgi:hypothetical protein